MRYSDRLRTVSLTVALLIPALAASMLPGCRSMQREPWELVPLDAGQIEKVRLTEQDSLSIDRVRFYSHEMQEPRFFLALVPKTNEALDTVLILNHGWSDRPESMLEALRLDQVYSRLLNDGRVHPALLVLPDVRFPDYYRRNSDLFPFPQYLTLVAEEVSETVSQQYKIPFASDKWCMGGFSFGGYLSLDVGRRYSGRFGSISAVSTFYDEDWLFWGEEETIQGKVDSQGRSKQTLVQPGPIPKLLLACGTNDQFFDSMLQLRRKFQELNIAHEWSSAPGGHTWSYWSSVLEEMLRFHLDY